MAYVPSSEDERIYLQNYDPDKYPKPAVAADTALFAIDGKAVKILLIRRGNYPYKNCWALPGGFVDMDEDTLRSARRELEEETGLRGIYLEQAFTWSEPGRDPRGRVITVSYIALADFGKLSPRAGDDAADAQWFAIEDYRSTVAKGKTHISYTLRGPEKLLPAVSFPVGRMQEIARTRSGGLAFDHAESVTYSVELLKHRVKHGQFAQLALGDNALAAYAREMILRI